MSLRYGLLWSHDTALFFRVADREAGQIIVKSAFRHPSVMKASELKGWTEKQGTILAPDKLYENVAKAGMATISLSY